MSVVFVVVLLGLLSYGPNALAGTNGIFTITVYNELGTSLSGATFSFKCAGGTLTAAVTDNGASDSNAAAGVISITSSQSAYFKTLAGCDGVVAHKALTVASLSFDGYQQIGSIIANYSSTSANTYSGATAMKFAVKVTLDAVSRLASTSHNITEAMVTASNGGVSCTAGTDANVGKYYCPVPLASTTYLNAAAVMPTVSGITGAFLGPTEVCTYAARATASGAQTTCTISATETTTKAVHPGTTAATPTPTLTPTPTPTLIVTTPTPSPTNIPTPASLGFTSLAALSLKEGDTISAAGSSDPDIYIANDWGYKRLFLNPVIFSFYGQLGGFANVKNIGASTRDTLVTSGLFRNCETNAQAVYGVEVTGEDTGVLHWVNVTGDQAVAQDPNFFQKVFCINNNEFNWYAKGSDYTSVNQIPSYSR
jgi:hypothetical protein